jgi:hypothetical protein
MSLGGRPSLVRSFDPAAVEEAPAGREAGRESSGGGGAARAPVRRRNRARTGKSSHPDYTKALAYIPEELYTEVRALVDSDRRASQYIRQRCSDACVRVFGKKPDYSELINALLVEFIGEYEDLYPE